MNQCLMAACLQNRQYSNGIMELQGEKSHAKLICVAIRPSNIYNFKQQNAFYNYQISDLN